LQETSTRFAALPDQAAAVLVDVGFTISVYDPLRISELLRPIGVSVSPEKIQATQSIIRTELSHSSWAFGPQGEGMQKGQAFFHRILTLAEAESESAATGLKDAAVFLWDRHLEDNLWSQLLPGAIESLSILRESGLRLAVISNAEGTIDALLQRLGLRDAFEFVLDSTVVGIAKPDPRIFNLALERLGIPANRAVMVGDSVAADVHGAWSAGISAALIDPLNLHPTCLAPRFDDLLAFAKALIPAK
jgi:HAD superfamily hydrolase (TIGR01509 family)